MSTRCRAPRSAARPGDRRLRPGRATLPVVEPACVLPAVPMGEVVEVVSDGPAVCLDVPASCRVPARPDEVEQRDGAGLARGAHETP